MTPLLRQRSFKSRVAKLLLGVVASVLLLALLEGLCSLALVARNVLTRTTPLTNRHSPEQRATRFDSEIGWVTGNDLAFADAAEPEIRVTTNAQGMRSRVEFAPAVPPGRIRALLTGDSFTFGTGVSDDATWAAALGRLEPRLEVANFGCGGYGLDQAWLRYRRDGAHLDHHLHLTCFISEDLQRMMSAEAWGSERPRVEVRDDQLVVTNLPLHQRSQWERKLKQSARFLGELKMVGIARSLTETKVESPYLFEDRGMRVLALRIFRELAHLAEERHARFIAVYLPTEDEYGGGSVDILRAYFRTELARLNVPFIDMVDEFRALSPDEHASLYLRRPSSAAGHYNAKGHEFVARTLQRKLREIPAVSELLDGTD